MVYYKFHSNTQSRSRYLSPDTVTANLEAIQSAWPDAGQHSEIYT